MIPGLLGKAVDQSVKVFESSQAGVEQLYWTALLLFLVSAIRGLSSFTHTFIGEAIGQNIGYLLRIKYFERARKFFILRGF